MGLLRHGVLEDDHGADRRLALDVRDVEALDPHRQALEVDALAQLLERLDAAEALALAVGGVALERELGVLLGEVLAGAASRPRRAARTSTVEPRRSERYSASASVGPASGGTTMSGGMAGALP